MKNIAILCFDPSEISGGFGPSLDSDEWETVEAAKEQIAKSPNPQFYKIFQEV